MAKDLESRLGVMITQKQDNSRRETTDLVMSNDFQRKASTVLIIANVENESIVIRSVI